MEKFTRNIA